MYLRLHPIRPPIAPRTLGAVRLRALVSQCFVTFLRRCIYIRWSPTLSVNATFDFVGGPNFFLSRLLCIFVRFRLCILCCHIPPTCFQHQSIRGNVLSCRLQLSDFSWSSAISWLCTASAHARPSKYQSATPKSCTAPRQPT